MNDRWADMEKALNEWMNKYKQLQAENKRMREICRQIQRFFKGIATVLDAEHIRKAYENSSTKAEIDEVLKEGEKNGNQT